MSKFDHKQTTRKRLAARLVIQAEAQGHHVDFGKALLAVNSMMETPHDKSRDEWEYLHETIGDGYRMSTDEREKYHLQTMYMLVGMILEEIG